MTAPADPFPGLTPLPRNHYGLLLHAAIARVLADLDQLSGAAARHQALIDAYRPALIAPATAGSPTDAGSLSRWWHRSVAAWEERHRGHLPLLDLIPEPGPPGTALRILPLVPALVEEDARFGALVGELQGGAAGPWPRVQWLGGLVGGLLGEGPVVTGVSDPWSRCRPLVDQGLLRVLDASAPRGLWALRLAPLLLDALRGELGERPASGLRLTGPKGLPGLNDLILPEPFRAELAGAADLIADGVVQTLVLRGGGGEMPALLAGALAARLGLGLLAVAAPALLDGEDPPLGPLCRLARALPLVAIDETAEPRGPGHAPVPESIPVPRLLSVGSDLALPVDGHSLVLDVPELGPGLRRCLWSRCLEGAAADLEGISEGCVLSAGHIPAVARGALSLVRGRSPAADPAHPDPCSAPLVGIPEVRRAAADLNRRELGPYADRLPATGSWSDLIAGESTRLRLLELERRCRYRERLIQGLGAGFGNSANRGVRALLSGPSGTGKTLAAKLLAAELGLDLYRVDLAAVINKYIGETEKNLKQVLGRAEHLDLVLLLDEGDALLGSRTEVRSSNDRYANLQTNYLLQRLEHYQGIVLVTTNLGDNIDGAFKRRMDVVVQFQPPGPQERLGILALHLPAEHRIDPGLLEQAAGRCALSGGQLRNAVMLARLLALDEALPIGNAHLLAALQSEYRKAGAAFPLDVRGLTAPGRGRERGWAEVAGTLVAGDPTPDPLDAYLSALAGGPT